MNHALLDRLTGSSDGMMWRQADHEQKRETSDVTITWGLDLNGPITEAKT